MSAARVRALGLLAIVALVVGVLCLIAAWGEPFTQPGGVRLWRLIHMNAFGALLTLVGGGVGVWAARAHSRAGSLAMGIFFAVVAVGTLFTIGSDANITGGRADTFTFWLALTVGPLALALTPDPDTE